MNQRKPQKIELLRGGTRSSKTYSLCQLIALWLVTAKFTEHFVYESEKCYIIRHTLPSLKRTVLSDFIDVLHSMDKFFVVDYNRTNLVFSYQRRSVHFLPADDSEKLKGLDPGITWINEADSVSEDAFNQLNMRTRLHLFADYNPSDSSSWCKKWEDDLYPTEDDIALDISTYHDNPFLTRNVIKEIERLERVDNDLFQVYNRGQWQRIGGLIFPNFHIAPAMPAQYDSEYYGIDFGHQDPTCIVHVRKQGMNLFIDELFYKSGALNDEVSKTLYRFAIRKIYADSAGANSIAELRKFGHRVLKAKKGKDSIVQGINKIKQHYIYITERSANIQMEFKRYKWQTDGNNELVRPSTPIKTYNHGADAIRYSLSMIMNRKLKW